MQSLQGLGSQNDERAIDAVRLHPAPSHHSFRHWSLSPTLPNTRHQTQNSLHLAPSHHSEVYSLGSSVARSHSLAPSHLSE